MYYLENNTFLLSNTWEKYARREPKRGKYSILPESMLPPLITIFLVVSLENGEIVSHLFIHNSTR